MEFVALHSSLEIKESDIHGMGIFAIESVPPFTFLGISHVKSIYSNLYHCSYVRTPLGAFVNHSRDPNCTKVKIFPAGDWSVLEGGATSSTMGIITLQRIPPGRELTVFYTIWDIRETFNRNKKRRQ